MLANRERCGNQAYLQAAAAGVGRCQDFPYAAAKNTSLSAAAAATTTAAAACGRTHRESPHRAR